MTARLQDVLNEIAGDLRPVDVTAAVQARARRMRWTRRAVAGGTALTVAATVGVVTLVVPNWRGGDGGITVATNEPVTTPSVAPVAESITLDGAPSSGIAEATSAYAVAKDDGSIEVYAADSAGDAVLLPADVPADLESMTLSTDGARLLLVGPAAVVVADVTTGKTIFSSERAPKVPYAMVPDGSAVFTWARSEGVVQAPIAPVWDLVRIDLGGRDAAPTGFKLQRNDIRSELWPAPDGSTVFVRFVDSVRDARTSRIDLSVNKITYSEPYTALGIERLVWSTDGSMMLAEMQSSVRVLEPNDEIGSLAATMSKAGKLVGFSGNGHVVWWRSIADGIELIQTDLDGTRADASTSVRVTGTVLRVAASLG